MIPSNNGKVEPCSHISSNCVIWQGPDISCINLCNGDTVSDVVAKLATELCNLVAASCTCDPTLTIDINCITGVADPTNLDQVIQGIIDYVCQLTPGGSTLPNITLCPNLQYQDSLGNLVTTLPLDQYAQLLGTEICSIIDQITLIQNDIANIFSRLVILEDCVLPCAPNEAADFLITSSCLLNAEVRVSELVLAIETAFCELRTATGDRTAISNAINAQCLSGVDDMLSGGGTYGNQSNWSMNVVNLAQSHANQWVAICDLYNAVQSIQENCCDSGCDLTTFNFATSTVGTPVTTVEFNFTTSDIPAGFSDCGSTIKITDQAGAYVNQAFDILAFQSSGTVSVAVGALDVTASLSVQVQFCVSDSANTCQETINRTIPLGITCPTVTISNQTNTTVDASWTNLLGSTVTYLIEAIDAGTLAVAYSQTITNPGVSITQTLTGLSAGTAYNVVLTITTAAGNSQVCTATPALTTGAACTSIVQNTVGSAAGTPDADWIYLGYDSVTPTDYYYDPGAEEIIPVNRIVTPVDIRTAFDGGGATDPTVSGAGQVNFDISTGGMTGSDTITVYYSTDGITFITGPSLSGGGIANPHTFNFATGVTTGKLYVRVQVENGGNKSPYAEFIWDFASSLFMRTAGPLTNVLADVSSSAYPNGLSTQSQSLTCSTSTYQITGSKIQWHYVRPYTIAGIQYYMYVEFGSTSGAVRVVFCCEVPGLLLTENIGRQQYVEYGGTGVYDIRFIAAEGAPTFALGSPPTVGALVDDGTIGTINENRNPLIRRYTYTHGGAVDHSDTFSLVLSNSVGTISESRSYQVQVVPNSYDGLPGLTKNVYAFIDTTSYSVSRGTTLINNITAWHTAFNTACSASGNLYIIPVQDNKWLGYAKAIVDDGVSATLDPAAGWVALRALPTSWTGGAAVPNTGVMMMAFSNESASDYHNTTLVAGFGAPVTQPTTAYMDNYDEWADILDGGARSAWGISQAFGGTSPFPDGVGALYYPTTGGPAAAEAAAVLQGLASYYARMIEPYEYGVKTAVDVTAYLMNGVSASASNPYEGSKTTTSTPIEALSSKKWLMMLDQGYTPPADWDFAGDRFDDDLTAAAKGGSNASCPP